MKRPKRPRPIPAWLRAVPESVAGKAAPTPVRQLLGGPDAGAAGPFARQLLDAAHALFQAAMIQAEEMRGPPGPLSMMLAVMRKSDTRPFADDDGPTARHAPAGWVEDMAHLINRTASRRDNLAECRRALLTTLNPTRQQLAVMLLPASRMAVALWFAVALLRRAIHTPTETETRLDLLAAYIHAMELHFWRDKGGWPWTPVDIPPEMLFAAQEQVARFYGQPAASGRA